LVTHRGGIVLHGDSKDMFYAYNKQPIVVIDCPRDMKPDSFPYSAIEKIADGVFLSTKYQSLMKVFKPPHIFVFAQFPPTVGSSTGTKGISSGFSSDRVANSTWNVGSGYAAQIESFRLSDPLRFSLTLPFTGTLPDITPIPVGSSKPILPDNTLTKYVSAVKDNIEMVKACSAIPSFVTVPSGQIVENVRKLVPGDSKTPLDIYPTSSNPLYPTPSFFVPTVINDLIDSYVPARCFDKDCCSQAAEFPCISRPYPYICGNCGLHFVRGLDGSRYCEKCD